MARNRNPHVILILCNISPSDVAEWKGPIPLKLLSYFLTSPLCLKQEVVCHSALADSDLTEKTYED